MTLNRDPKLTALSLKWNPFSPELPVDALRRTRASEAFCGRVERLAREGGFALLTGEPGLGKSATLRLLREKLKQVPDLLVGVLVRPHGSVPDFYRELGELFHVDIQPHNRWAGARELRRRWRSHLEAVLCKPVLLVDEAQEMRPVVLNELRLLAAGELDAQTLLTVVLAGDGRLPELLQRHAELQPLESRLRVRATLDHFTPDELVAFLGEILKHAGNATLIAQSLHRTLAERAGGNLRTLMNICNELLDAAAARDARQIDEKLFLELFTPAPQPARAPRQRQLLER